MVGGGISSCIPLIGYASENIHLAMIAVNKAIIKTQICCAQFAGEQLFGIATELVQTALPLWDGMRSAQIGAVFYLLKEISKCTTL